MSRYNRNIRLPRKLKKAYKLKRIKANVLLIYVEYYRGYFMPD